MKLFKFLLAIVTLSHFYSCAPDKEGYTLKGNIHGLGSTKVFIQSITDSGFVYTDSTEVDKGKFIFKGSKIEEPYIITLFINNKKGKKEPLNSSFYLENGEINLTGNIDQRGKIKVLGSKETTAERAIRITGGMAARYRQIQNIFFKAEINNRTIPDDSISALNKELRALEAVRKEKLSNIIKENADTYAALHWVLRETDLFSRQELKQFHSLFSKDIQQSPSFAKLGKIVKSSSTVGIGSTLQDFVLPDTTGSNHSIQSLKGELVLVDFWASWCGPCRKQIPALLRIYKENKLKGFDIVAISLDDDKDKWKAALGQEQMPWLNLLGKEGDWAQETYLVSSIPANFLLDKNGRIVGKNLSTSELQLALKKFLH